MFEDDGDDDFDRLLQQGGLFSKGTAPNLSAQLFGSSAVEPKSASSPSRTEVAEEKPKSRSSSKSSEKKKEKHSSSKSKGSSSSSAAVSTPSSAPVPPPAPPQLSAPSSNSSTSSAAPRAFLGELLAKTKHKRSDDDEEDTSAAATASRGTNGENKAVKSVAFAAAAAPSLPTQISSSSSSPGSGGVSSKSSSEISTSTQAILKKLRRLEKSLDEIQQAHNAHGIKEVKHVFSNVFVALKPRLECDGIFDGAQVTALLKETMRKCIHEWQTSRDSETDPVVERMDSAQGLIDGIKEDISSVQKAVSAMDSGKPSSTPSISNGTNSGGDERLEKALKQRIAILESEVATLEKKNEKIKSSKKMAKRKVEELQMWQGAVPELRRLLEQTVEEKEHLNAQLQDLQRLQRGLKVTWVPDVCAAVCLNCDAPFSLLKWKNHCRHCGRVFCYDCTSRKLEIPDLGYNYDVPVCDHCFNLLRAKTPSRR